MGVRERKVENYLDKEVKKLGGLTRKWVSPGRDGVPDRIVIMPIVVAELIKKLQLLDPNDMVSEVNFVEVKTIDGTRSKNQQREQKRLIKAGALVNTVYGDAGVDEFVSTL